MALHAQGQLGEAEQLYCQVLASDPDNPIVLINWGHTLNGLRRFAAALEAYDRALARDPSQIFLHIVRGDVLQWLLRYDEALAVCYRFPRYWRWFLGRAVSLWYPSPTLFRQRSMGDWASVFDAMANALISRRS